MKNIIYLILFITEIFFAQNSFEKGNTLYQKGKYEQAIAQYESVLANQQHSSELYFNLGNCYYKLNKVAPSIYNYEKALLLNPDDSEIRTNLEFAQKLQIDEIKVLPKVGFSKLILDFTSLLHYNTWAWISVGLSTLFLLLFIGYYFSQYSSSKRVFFIGMIVILVLLLTATITSIVAKKVYEAEKPAIVFAESIEVKSEPQKASTTAFILHEGTKVFVLESMSNWKKIQLTDGTEGWLDKNAIKEIK